MKKILVILLFLLALGWNSIEQAGNGSILPTAKTFPPSIVPESSATQHPTMIPSETVTSGVTVMPSSVNSPSPSANKYVWDSMLMIGYGEDRSLDCSLDHRNKVYMQHASDERFRVLLASDTADYQGATWSPDGRKIAFIISKPSNWYGRSNEPIKGTDSLWIMDADGSNQKQIGNGLPSMIAKWADGCFQLNHIDGSPLWSPDNKHIVLVYWKYIDGVEFEYQYFLADLDTLKMQSLNTQSEYSLPFWSEDGRYLVIFGKDHLRLYDIANLSHPSTIKFPTSEKIQKATFIYPIPCFQTTQIDSCQEILIDFQKDGSHSIWSFGIADSQWEHRRDLSFEEEWEPVAFENKLTGCDQGSVRSINIRNNDVADTTKLPNSFSCRYVTGLERGGEVFLVIYGKKYNSDEGDSSSIFYVDKAGDYFDLVMAIPINLESSLVEDLQILDYSFQSGD